VNTLYGYDLSNTGYNPTFNDGVYSYTSPVDHFAPNRYGVYDMAGSVWQWCWDWYDESWYAYAGATKSDRRRPVSSPYGLRMLRGGSWVSSAYFTRCTNCGIFLFNPDVADSSFRFRCARGF
jgi:formylglycine-generating enzyme required for sulfatase activity